MSIVFIKTIKAILQTLPGLYRDTMQKALSVLETRQPEVLSLSCDELVEHELQFYWIVHPLQPTDESYNSPLLLSLVRSGLLCSGSDKVSLLNRAFLRRQTRVILIQALESCQVLQQRSEHLVH